MIASPKVDESFPKSRRLLKRAEFRGAERRGTRRASKHFVVIARTNLFDFSRLGTTVSRKVGNAVARNRWKRRLREIFRRHRDEFPASIDYVVIVRKQISPSEPPFDALKDELIHLFVGAGKALGKQGE